MGFLIAGIVLFIVIPPKGKSIELLPPPTPSPIFIHVDGAVQKPGLYQLDPQNRVQDAIQAAGGFLSSADTTQINLAGKIYDGQKIYVPSQQENSSAPLQTHSTNFPININLASLDELQTLPGIGELKAKAIIQYREENGPFQEIEDILNVPGIGDSIFNNLKNMIAVK